jgi:hypothetical protein
MTSKADKIRSLLAEGMTPARVAKMAGVDRAYVYQVRKASATRGRPRKTTHPAEACARMLEDDGGEFALSIAERIRRGEWKDYLKCAE